MKSFFFIQCFPPKFPKCESQMRFQILENTLPLNCARIFLHIFTSSFCIQMDSLNYYMKNHFQLHIISAHIYMPWYIYIAHNAMVRDLYHTVSLFRKLLLPRMVQYRHIAFQVPRWVLYPHLGVTWHRPAPNAKIRLSPSRLIILWATTC